MTGQHQKPRHVRGGSERHSPTVAARRPRHPPWPGGAGSAAAVGAGAAAAGGGGCGCDCGGVPGAPGGWGGGVPPRAARTGSTASQAHSRCWSARPRTGTHNQCRHQDKWQLAVCLIF